MSIAETDSIFIADRITKRRFRSGKAQYYVKWKGCPSSYNTWEPEGNILDPGLILEFEARLADACSKGKRPGRKPKLLKLKVVDLERRPHEHGDAGKRRWMEHIEDTPMPNKNNNMDWSSNAGCVFREQVELNNNLQAEKRSGDKWKVPRKSKSLFLEQTIKDTQSNRDSHSTHFQNDNIPFEVYGKAVSPLMGLVLPPNYGQNYEQDCAKDRNAEDVCKQTWDRDSDNNGNRKDVSSLDTPLVRQPPTTQQGEGTHFDLTRISSTLTDGNSVKLGKFALLRKYRSSLEESDCVTSTDVTVEGVTVTVRESDRPQGFFGPKASKPWSLS